VFCLYFSGWKNQIVVVYLLHEKLTEKKGMEKVVTMSQTEYKRFLIFKEADKIVRSIRKGLQEAHEATEGKRVLKSAYQLADEL
jgi:hypothetical protein